MLAVHHGTCTAYANEKSTKISGLNKFKDHKEYTLSRRKPKRNVDQSLSYLMSRSIAYEKGVVSEYSNSAVIIIISIGFT